MNLLIILIRELRFSLLLELDIFFSRIFFIINLALVCNFLTKIRRREENDRSNEAIMYCSNLVKIYETTVLFIDITYRG